VATPGVARERGRMRAAALDSTAVEDSPERTGRRALSVDGISEEFQ
jgi:hypothetical protein